MQFDIKNAVLYAGFSTSYGILTLASSYFTDSVLQLPSIYKKHMGNNLL